MLTKYNIKIFISLLVSLVAFAVKAELKLPLPRFVTVKSNEVNARSGPGVGYPIEWIYVQKGLPIEIIDEQWRQIRDIKGEGGWVHSSVLSGKRSVIIATKESCFLYKQPTLNSKILAKLMSEVICKLNKCSDGWCKITCGEITGYIPHENIWGVYKHEKF